MAIKSFELEPTRENLMTTLMNDLLGRNESVWQFARFCDSQEGKCSIAVDAKWGQGKTFFVRHVQLLLSAFNENTDSVSDVERDTIKQVFGKYKGSGTDEVELQPQVCVYYDAWANDNADDPILSLIYEIIKDTAQHYSIKKSTDCINAAAIISDFFTGKNAAEVVASLRGKDILSELKNQKEIHETIADFLESLLFEQGNRLVVFIDELDRCKPSYAVKLLERIKHYFSNDRITFVFSVNTDELQHVIMSYYGDGFNAYKYLDRFFDYRIALPPAKLNGYYQHIGLADGMWVYESVCKAVIETYSFSLRELEKYYRMARVAAYEATHNQRFYDFSDENALSFSLHIVVPIIIGLRMIDAKLYNDFIAGNNPQPLIDVIGDRDIARGICSTLLDKNETYADSVENRTTVKLQDKLCLAYAALLKDSSRTEWGEKRIGSCLFTQRTKNVTLQVSSLLSNYASY